MFHAKNLPFHSHFNPIITMLSKWPAYYRRPYIRTCTVASARFPLPFASIQTHFGATLSEL